MEFIFLGTAANNPTPERNVSCTCFRIDGEIWLFDAGEATQIQFMKSSVKPGKITKVFITHLHGDHIFGLPGLLCTISQNVQDDRLLEIYGPLGTRRYIRTNLELSRSMLTYKYVVHEMIPIDDQIPDAIKKWNFIQSDDSILHPSEILGKQITINEQGFWNLFENEKVKVISSWIRHRIPTFGFVIDQKPTPGKLNDEALKKIGVPQGPLYGKIKSGITITLENGTVIDPKDFICPPKPGKKLTILGDCYEVSNDMLNASKNSDLLIHEATLEDAFKEKAISNGHSTPTMAANVATSMNCKCLILNHVSQRYKPLNYAQSKPIEKNNNEVNNESIDDGTDDTVEKLLNEAKKSFNGPVYVAYDLWTYKI